MTRFYLLLLNWPKGQDIGASSQPVYPTAVKVTRKTKEMISSLLCMQNGNRSKYRSTPRSQFFYCVGIELNWSCVHRSEFHILAKVIKQRFMNHQLLKLTRYASWNQLGE